MFEKFARGAVVAGISVAALWMGGAAHAVMAPEPDAGAKGSGAPMRMLDARVNAKDAWQRSIAARPGAAAALQAARGSATSIAAAIADQRRSTPGLSIKVSGVTGAPSSIVNTAGALTTAVAGKATENVVRDYLRGPAGAMLGLSSADVDDLHVLGDSAGGYSGMRMLRVEQRVNGRPVFQSESRFLVDRDGRLSKYVGLIVPQARAITPADPVGKLSAPAAASRLFASLGKSIPDAGFVAGATVNDRVELTASDSFVAGPVSAREVYFPLAPGVLVPAWSLVAFTSGKEDWYSIVDAQTGDVLWRKNIRAYASTHEARFRVYVQADGKTPADSPAPLSPTTATPGSGLQATGIAPTIVNMSAVQDLLASPNGWIDDCPAGGCTANQTQTLGNNVLACLDRTGGADVNVCDTDAASVLDGNGRPTGNPDANGRNRDFLGTAPRDFQTNFLPPPQGGNPEAGQTATGSGNNGTLAIDQYRRGVVTHLFYLTNWYHDQTFRLGFDEASANFQQTNFSGNGVGGDRVLADAQDGGGTNNANFATPPDGQSGRMQMYRFTGPTIDRDGSLDAEIVLHELTHGLSNRLVGNAAGLNWDPAGGMGEGWSDFYALSLLNNTSTDDPNGKYASGAYATYKLGGLLDNYLYGIRRFPYSTDITVNPLTWGDVDDVTYNQSGGIAASPLGFELNGAMEVHNIGEIWANTLWQMRANIIADPAGANGDVPIGNRTALQLVTDGLKATPIDPSFTDARDALIDADCVTNACTNERSIWLAFSKRGLGWGARTPYNKAFGYPAATHTAVAESFAMPYLSVNDETVDVVVNDNAPGNAVNGVVDPGEAVRLSVTLFNPWRRASQAASAITSTLTTATPGVTIHAATSAYPNIAAQGSAANTTPFVISVLPSVAAGAPLDFTLTTTSSLGTTTTTFRMRVGTRSGTLPVVTYQSTIAPALAIPDNRPRGVTNTLTVTDDYEIADLDFRVDQITHTWTGDVTVMLRSPDGTGTDLIGLIGALAADRGNGDNIVNMVIDDSVAATAANDMVQATAAAAPFTKTWLPVYNAPWTVPGLGVPPDSIGSLSRFNGRSTKGTWTTLVSDGAAGDTGTMAGWSMLVTPVRFVTAAVIPSVVMAATKTVSGTFRVGGTVTYTVTLTNSGNGVQADNAGNEFTDTLPSSLTLVSASATSGTATTAGNTANWNGSLAPLGGSVTITITATVNAGAQGTTVSNQGTVSFDADVNGSNESTLQTDDPGVAGAANPTQFVVQNAAVTATKTVAGTFAPGSTVTYTVTISNTGSGATTDNPGNEFTDVLPAGLTLVSATASSGTAVATVGTNTVTWNGGIAAGGSVTVTITATVTGAVGAVISNQGTVSFDADLNGSNESTVQTDDPSVAGAANPTTFTVRGAVVAATKTVSSGPYKPGSTLTYTITLTNTGNAATTDNPGNEMTDVLPSTLGLQSATATAGIATATVATNTVTWNGAIAAGGSVTITIQAWILPTAANLAVSNQATFAYDADLNGTNETTGLSDDPRVAGSANATVFLAEALPMVPTVNDSMLLLIALALGLFGVGTVVRQRRG